MAHTIDIVSTFSYLIGVDKKYFREEGFENTFASIEIFNKLELSKPAKIVRSLCLVRNGFMNNFSRIVSAINGYNGISAGIHGFYEYIDEEAINYLIANGMTFKYQSWAANYIVEINKYLSDRINNCKNLFPEFVEWLYLKDLFIMPNGTSAEGCKTASDIFYANKSCYPFCCYLNWKLISEDHGKSLYNDFRFLTNLYEDNKSKFDRPELVSDDSENNKQAVSQFLLKGNTEIIIDCENANPFFIYSFLNTISDDAYNLISKVILFNDVNASTAWKALPGKFDDIDFEEVSCDRVLDRKSMVDVKLITRTVKEYYENNVRSFILVSSDSDFYGMIQELPKAEFMLVVQRSLSAYAFRETAISDGVSYIYVEDYPYSEAYDFLKTVIYSDFKKKLSEKWTQINIAEEIEEICRKTYAYLTDAEKDSILKSIAKNMKIEIGDDYSVKIVMDYV